MPLPDEVNLDVVSAFTVDQIRSAIREWRRGSPRDETSLMNHLTGRLTRTSRGCDVGLTSRMIVYPRVFESHRRGARSTDRHGADFAVTFTFEPSMYTKTALFQLKLGTNHRAVLERRQLSEMTKDDRAASRAFVMYVNTDRIGVRIQSTEELLEEFKSENAATQQFETTRWQSESEWLLSWMKCDIGPESDLEEENTIEGTLVALEHAPDSRSNKQPFPADAWLVHVFAPPNVDYDDTAFADFFRHYGHYS